MPHPGWPDPKVSWERGSHPDWRADVAAVPWQKRDDQGYVDWVKILGCPRCGHEMSLTVGPGALRDATTPGGGVGEVAAFCNCESGHEDRPEKRPLGCGYNGWVPAPEAAR